MIHCPRGVSHDVRNLGAGRGTLVFLKMALGLLGAVVPSAPAEMGSAAKPA